jgi:hypothetical protein
MDFERLAAGAESQHAQVEERRLQIARRALSSAVNPGLSSAHSN